MSRINFTLMLAVLVSPLQAAEDDPLLLMGSIDHLERVFADQETATHLEATAWIGYDHNKLYLKSEMDREDGEFHESEHQLLYSRAVSPFWDLQLGFRKDFEPTPEREWGVIGLQGIAPGFIDTEAALFVQEDGDFAARVTAEYELLLTQRLELAPELELNFSGQEDATRGIGSGVTDTRLALRLKYQVRRELVPYIGLSWESLHGETADIARVAGGEARETAWLVGLHAWF